MIEIPAQGAAHFASDLHLSEHTPKTLEAFEHWIASVAQPQSLVFLLGDVFEVWCGDDHDDEVPHRVARATRAARQAGARVFFMHGNRDFLIGERFAGDGDFELLPDPEFVQTQGGIVLITHGDQLCTDDKAYQQFRQLSRDETWQADFLAKPRSQRLAIAQGIRTESKTHKSNTAMAIMDVNAQAVKQAYAGRWPDGYFVGKCHTILHGHTHRCAVHTAESPLAAPKAISQEGTIRDGMRIVLPDWNYDTPNQQSAKGGYLTLKHSGEFQLTVFR
ncbi:UDP-2,3-diacylglucosamine diphosphatase [Limnobacter sp.]|uniref:UDP-2,3-diacylglucosamine diphosphatase n=1 Tax=Limnobacter sp. TaxID=2003368 RepID=UPI0035145BEF